MTEANGIRPLLAGNWKMNGLKAALNEALAVSEAISTGSSQPADVMICPPATLLMVLAEVTRDGRLQLGAQDCHWNSAGAHTGDLSAEMVKDAGGVAVILGHSERRSDHGELDRHVRAKAEAAHRAGLTAIICVGETWGERSAGLTLEVVGRQLAGSVPDGATAPERGDGRAPMPSPAGAAGCPSPPPRIRRSSAACSPTSPTAAC